MDKNPLAEYGDGFDVPTLVGVSQMKDVMFPHVMVDYAEMPNLELRKSFTKDLEGLWNEDYFKRGFKLIRMPSGVRVESRRSFFGMTVEEEDVNTLEAPSYFVDAAAEENALEKFYELLEKKGLWIFHIRTELASYYFVVVHPAGTIATKVKKDPAEVEIRGNQ